MEKIKFAPIESNDRFKVMRAIAPTGAVMAPHIADKSAFLLIEDGEIEFTLDQQQSRLKDGDSLRIPAEVVHHIRVISDCKILLMLDAQVKIRFVDQ